VPKARDEHGSLPPPGLTEEDLAYRASLEKLVDWYRVQQSGALVRAFLPGALVLLPLGSLIVALSMAPLRIPEHLRPLLTLLGVLVTATGPLWAILQLFRSIRGDLYVAIRLDGLGVRLDPQADEVVYPWDAICEVRYDRGASTLWIELEAAAPVAIRRAFAELSLEELARRIRDARRLAIWNRLLPRYPKVSFRSED
jgi:hypothetical protein